MVLEPADDRILRAKYLDWCSAQVADRFLKLTPDEIYQLAHEPPGAGEGGLPAEVEEALRRVVGAVALDDGVALRAATQGPEPSAPGLSYRVLVQRVTEALRASVALPPFERWVESYRASPERYEAELLGFWEDGGATGRQ